VPHSPSNFYKCPHCHHVLLKDSQMMMLAGTDAGFGIIGGGCPDCHQPLDAEKVYKTCEYDLSIAEIAAGNYGQSVIDNILAAQRSRKISLSPEELSLLIPVSPRNISARRVILLGTLFTVLIIAAVIAWFTIIKQTPDKFGLPPTIKTSVLSGAVPGSKIISAQMVQQSGLDFWCVVTGSGGELERWVASDMTSTSVFVIQDASWENFSKIGCTNWSEQQISGGIASATQVLAALETGTMVPGVGEADFIIPLYGLVFEYDTNLWQVSTDCKSLFLSEQPTCRINYPETIYDGAEAPTWARDRSSIIDGITYDVYNIRRDEIFGAMYRVPSGVNQNVNAGMPVIFYVWTGEDDLQSCTGFAEDLFATLRIQP
jgi:hypothetical protein